MEEIIRVGFMPPRSHQCLYKCRLCGQTFTRWYDFSAGGDIEEIKNEMWGLCNAYPEKRESEPAEGASLMTTHDCAYPYQGSIGVADLLGIVPVTIFPEREHER